MIRHKQSGLTLLEVLVALAVFAIAASAVVRTLGQQINNLPMLEERTQASWVAANVLVDTRLMDGFVPLGEKSGEQEMLDKKWFWKRKVIKTVDENFRRIDVQVSQHRDFRTVAVERSTYVAKLDK